MTPARTRLRRRLRQVDAEELKELGAADFMDLSDADAAGFAELLNAGLDSVEELMALPVEAPETRWRERDLGRPVRPGEDPYNAFVHYCQIKGAGEGPLAGRRFAVKDNLSIAGLPTSNASAMAASVAGFDATIVDRLLDAGGELVGKTNLEELSAGATGESSVWGPPLNPFDPAYSCGGSSAGSAAAAAARQVDFAIGVDQGGSVRIPASYTGVVGLIATHGYVPTFGLTSLDQTLDYIAPLAPDVETCALALDAMTGPDPRDAQWKHREPRRTSCAEHLGDGVEGLRIGVIEEAGDEEDCDPAVLANFGDSLRLLREAGAKVERTSLPQWKFGWSVETALLGVMAWSMNLSEGIGFGNRGYVDEGRAHSYALARRLETGQFPPAYRFWVLLGRYLQKYDHGAVYAHCQNLRYQLTQDVWRKLEEFDLLVTPTTPRVSVELATELRADPEFLAAHAGANFAQNTAPANLTGNPAIAVPDGLDEAGLPTSFQFIAAAGDDERAFAAAQALQERIGVLRPAGLAGDQ
jgi:amidase